MEGQRQPQFQQERYYQSYKIRISEEYVTSFVVAEQNRRAPKMQEEVPALFVPVQEVTSQEETKVIHNIHTARGERKYTRRGLFNLAGKATLATAAAVLLGVNLNRPKTVEADTIPDSLWFWEGSNFQAYMSNIDGLKEINGVMQVNPFDIGVHLNFRIQPLGGGEDLYNWHLQFFQDPNNYYFKGIETEEGFTIGGKDGILSYSKYAMSLDTAAEEANFQIGLTMSEIGEGVPTGDPITGDWAAMFTELQFAASNIITLKEMLISLASVAEEWGNDVLPAVE
jgi:hypothetical protein